MRIAVFAAAFGILAAAPALAQDAAEGEKVFRKCAACHEVGEDAKAKVGPVLNNMFGKPAGSNEEFASKYSKAMKEAGEGGLVWTPETVAQYLEKPRDFIKGNRMAFAGLRKEEERSNVVAYLLQFSPEYTPE